MIVLCKFALHVLNPYFCENCYLNFKGNLYSLIAKSLMGPLQCFSGFSVIYMQVQ